MPPQGNDTCGFDMAMVILTNAGIPANVAQPYVPRIDVDPVQGEIYQAVGYGVTNPALPSSGNRMSRGNLRIQCAPGECRSGVEGTEFMGETGVCSGDSGGPALDAKGKVIGVVSRGVEPCDSPVYGSVSKWRDWILQVGREAAELGGYPPPFWVTTGKSDPEPAWVAPAVPVGAVQPVQAGVPESLRETRKATTVLKACPARRGISVFCPRVRRTLIALPCAARRHNAGRAPPASRWEARPSASIRAPQRRAAAIRVAARSRRLALATEALPSRSRGSPGCCSGR